MHLAADGSWSVRITDKMLVFLSVIIFTVSVPSEENEAKTEQTTLCRLFFMLLLCCGPGAISFPPYPFTSPPSTLSFIMFYFFHFPLLTCFIYFLAFSSLPILPE